jgi:hypothetical protein
LRLLLALRDGIEVAIDRDLRRGWRTGRAQLEECGLGQIERSRGIVGAREIHLRAGMVGKHREDALEGNDRVIELSAVERGHPQEVVEFRHARKPVLHRDELGEGLLRVARGQELAGTLDHRVVGGEGRCRCAEATGHHPTPQIRADIHVDVVFLIMTR